MRIGQDPVSLRRALLGASLLLNSLKLMKITILHPTRTRAVVKRSLKRTRDLLTRIRDASPTPGPRLDPGSGQRGPHLTRKRNHKRNPNSKRHYNPNHKRQNTRLARTTARLNIARRTLHSTLNVPTRHPPHPSLTTTTTRLNAARSRLHRSVCGIVHRRHRGHRPKVPKSPPSFATLTRQCNIDTSRFQRVINVPGHPSVTTTTTRLNMARRTLQRTLHSTRNKHNPNVNNPNNNVVHWV